MHYLEALEKLKKGSKLYLECQSNPSIFHQELREELKNKGQKPYVTIITCSDSSTTYFFCKYGRIIHYKKCRKYNWRF